MPYAEIAATPLPGGTLCATALRGQFESLATLAPATEPARGASPARSRLPPNAARRREDFSADAQRFSDHVIDALKTNGVMPYSAIGLGTIFGGWRIIKLMG